MKYFVAALTLIATPAWAHHEVIVISSMLPLFGGVVAVFAGIVAALKSKNASPK